MLLALLAGELSVAAETAEPGATVEPAVRGTEAEPALVTAPVILDGRTLFRVRGISAYPADRRAQLIAERIRAFAEDKAVSPQSLHVVEREDMSTIDAGKHGLMAVFNADARAEGLQRRQVLAEILVIKIRAAVEAFREERSPEVLLTHTLYALAAIVALVAALFGLRWAFKRLDREIEWRYKTKIHDLEIGSFRVLEAEQVWTTLRAAVRTAWVLAALVLVYASLHFVLSLYPWSRPLAQQILDLLLNPLRIMGTAVVRAIPNLIFLMILIIIVRYVLKTAWLFFAAIERGRVKFSGFDRDWAWPTYRIFRLLAIAFAAVVAYPYIPGSESAAFKGMSLFLGVIFSLGSTSVISNIIAGYTMTYRRAFKVGDRIQINDLVGDVAQMRLLVTRLHSLKNEEVVVPNSVILNSHIINFSTLAKQPGLILHTTVGIGYETPWRQVEAMLLQAAERTPELLREPRPFVLQKSLDDFCITYELNVYSDKPHAMPQLYTALHRNILDVFNEYGVQIMTPAYMSDTAQPKVVPKEQWFAPPAKPSG